MLIRDVIRNREPYSTRATATVQEAAEFMAARNIGAVCVVDDGGRLLGVFSERDVLNRVVVAKRDPNNVKVGDVTSELRAVIQCDETVDICPLSTATVGSACSRCAICCVSKLANRGMN
jgi:CBS domain-containing protein